jgi:hypothetical protein
MPRPACSVPESLAKAARRFERWRKERTGRQIPDPLWRRAVKLARSFGICQTSRALGLNYEALKKRLQLCPNPSPFPKTSSHKFLEILPGSPTAVLPPTLRPSLFPFPESPSQAGCVVELLRPDGFLLRIHLRGQETLDLTALTREFRGGRP